MIFLKTYFDEVIFSRHMRLTPTATFPVNIAADVFKYSKHVKHTTHQLIWSASPCRAARFTRHNSLLLVRYYLGSLLLRDAEARVLENSLALGP